MFKRAQPSRFSAALCLVLGLAAAPLWAADHAHHGQHGAAPASQSAASVLSDGVVKKADKASGKLTVAHGPLPNGMPAMTMAFPVKEAAWLSQFQPGQKIRFAVDDVAGVMTLVRIEAAK